jgi:hypothetical protein
MAPTRRFFLQSLLLTASSALLAACQRTIQSLTSTPTRLPPSPTSSPQPSLTPTSTSTTTPTLEPTLTQTATASPSSTPTPTRLLLLSPADGAELPQLGRIHFSWEAYPAAALYRLEITAPTGTTVTFDTTLPSHDRYAESLPWGGEFSWHVLALDAAGSTLCASQPWRFSKPRPPAQATSSPGDAGSGAGSPGSDGSAGETGGPQTSAVDGTGGEG